MNLYKMFSEIMQQEVYYILPPSKHPYRDVLFNPEYFENLARRILEITENSTVLRCCATNGRLTEDIFASESVAAHTNLVLALTDYAIDHPCYPRENHSHYSHREITEAIRLHDLPENEIGDIPDNENLEHARKATQEAEYYKRFFSYYPNYRRSFIENVKSILAEMESKSTELGSTIYLADKISAIIMALYYDSIDLNPYAKAQDRSLSRSGRKATELCDRVIYLTEPTTGGIPFFNSGYYLSELWTIDYFIGRRLYRYDFNGFFTATLVMTTLITKGHWYKWRENDYRHFN